MATNKLHSGKKCGPCSLCKQKKFHYTHISEWSNDQKLFLKTTEANISPSSCICKVCADDIKRNMHKDNYTPRWRKTKPKCTVIGCKNVRGIKLCNITNNANMEQLLELENTTTAVTLCTDHYNVVYRSLPEKVNLLAHQKCKTCNREISKKTDYHHCPDPRVIKEYLRSTVGYDVDINRADIICLTCYKAHKTILEQENEQSKDKDLQELMVTLKTADIPSVVDSALNEVTLAVAETIYKQEAILLPTAYDMLTKLMRDQAVIGNKGISKQHLFSHLKQTLNKHLACCTLQKSAGTLLYRKDGNLLLALTLVLQRERKGKLDGEGEHSSSNNESSNSNQQDEPQTDNSLLAKVCTTMNTKLHHQAKKFMDKRKTDEMDLTSLDMDQLIDSIDPALWSMIINLTKSCREADKHPLTHSRKLRCFYCLCVMLFITNNQCNKPLHVLLTDVLASHIGAQDKIKILNQLGAVASEDTHARYCQDIVQKKRQEGNTSLLSTFVAISVDNVGFLQSHAAIYSGDQHRSWQGTTVQALVYQDSNATCSSSINAQSTLSNNKNDSPQATPSLSQTSEGVQATPQTSEGVQATHPPSRTSTGVQVTETPSLTPTSSGVRPLPLPHRLALEYRSLILPHGLAQEYGPLPLPYRLALEYGPLPLSHGLVQEYGSLPLSHRLAQEYRPLPLPHGLVLPYRLLPLSVRQ